MKPKKKLPKKFKKTGNIIRIQGEISTFVNQPETGDDNVPAVKKKSRKQIRKQNRQLKKSKKNAYFRKQTFSETIVEETVEKPVKVEKAVKKQSEVKKKKKKVDSVERIKKKQLQEALERDEKEIKRLEKQMNMHKRKSKNLPQSFVLDGMDYLLDFCDSENRTVLPEPDFADDDSDFQEDIFEAIEKGKDATQKSAKTENSSDESGDEDEKTSKKRKATVLDDELCSETDSSESVNIDDIEDEAKPLKNKKQVKWKDLEEMKSLPKNPSSKIDPEELDSDESDSYKSEESDEENEATESELSDNEFSSEESNDELQQNETSKLATKNKGNWEDIYGRLRDKDGNIINQSINGVSKYIPPAQRLASNDKDEKKKELVDRIRRQLKGFLNRLSESNMQNISNQIEDMYMRYSRHDMNITLIELLIQSCVSPALTPERLVSEHAMLVAILHANVGLEVGAQVVQNIIDRFNELLNKDESHGEGKESDNLLYLISYLYNFQVVHCSLIKNLLKKLAEIFKEKDIELILLLLKTVGFTLRKDDPLLLKEIISELQVKAATVKNLESQNRVRFMLDTVMAIKNNNMQKIPNYDPSRIEHMRKLVRGMIRTGNYISELRVSLDDLLNVKERGRWWIVGSAWSGKLDPLKIKNDNELESVKNITENVSDKILQLAHEQRMNTDVRKNIFCILMTAEDYIDAFEKLLKLSLKNQQEREIIFVSVDCCLHEAKFNLFYALIINKFCEYDRRFTMTAQCAIWDRLKELDQISKSVWTNLAQLLSTLLIKKGLSISILKVIEFSDMNKKLVKFLRQILLSIILHESEAICKDVFLRISPSPKMKAFREGLKLFIQHFILRNKESLASEDIHDHLIKRCELAKSTIMLNESKLKL